MNERGIEEVISTLYELVQDARGLPLGADRCIVDRDKVLDLLDEISNQLPGELKQAKTIVQSRSEVINNAKREAENILRQAQAQAREMVTESEIYRQAQSEGEALINAAQEKIRELKQVTNEYVDDAMRRTEESISEALAEIQDTRAKFAALTSAQPKNSPIVPDVD